jgi:hypothetical protein
MSLYMETTKIAAEKTAQEIGDLLRQAGAKAVMIEYSEKHIADLFFRIDTKKGERSYRLPARVTPVFMYLQKARAPRNRGRNEEYDLEQAERVAWRQIKKWVEAQLALIEVGMVDVGEIFFPYMQVSPDHTVYDYFQENPGRLLPAPLEG